MTNQLFIIGSGFDLHHKIASRYSDFASYLEGRDRAIFDIAEKYVVPEKDLWSYLEERLAEVDIDQIEEYAWNFLVSYEQMIGATATITTTNMKSNRFAPPFQVNYEAILQIGSAK